jgi:hypothetical protein
MNYKVKICCMRLPVVKTKTLNLQVWFLTVLACYAVLELSFNHRLLELAGELAADHDPRTIERHRALGACCFWLGSGPVIDALA